MTATPAEFGNSLKAAFADKVTAGEGWFQVNGDGACLRFDYLLLTPLRVGILALPRMEITVSVLAGDAQVASRLLDAIDRVTQRGGG